MIILFFLLFSVASCAFTGNDCNGKLNTFEHLKLGLPPSSSNFISGYLPTPSNWSCQSGQNNFRGARGIFIRYHSGAEKFEVGISPTPFSDKEYSLYMYWRGNNPDNRYAQLRVCKWRYPFNLTGDRWPERGVDCLIKTSFLLYFEHGKPNIIGLTWAGDRLRLHGLKTTRSFYLPNRWDTLSFRCYLTQSCVFQPVFHMSTFNVTTNADGLITDYELCQECDGFPRHVFAVEEGGLIPADFDYTNWFLLTNTSSLIDGRVVSSQPLRINCLWPVPALASTAALVNFTISDRQRCNGFVEENVTSDVLRFSLNFSSDQRVLGGVGSVTLYGLESPDFQISFSCVNDTDPYTRDHKIIFGPVPEPYYCFAGFNGSFTFVGMLPPVLREIAVSRLGAIYLNGYRVFQTVPLSGVYFNVTGHNGSDFWTVAYTSYADVLVEVNSTSITRVAYCDSPYDKLKCQQLSFDLPNGFYPATSIFMEKPKRTFVSLPQHFTHSFVQLYVTYSNRGGSSHTPPTSHAVRFIGYNDTTGEMYNVSERTVCIQTTQFTTNLTFDAPDPIWVHPNWSQPASLYYELSITSVDCPFNFKTLNDYVTFESICFSLDAIPGACSLKINKVWSTYVLPFSALYVTYKVGNTITGVPQPNVGVLDQSVVHLGECTDYTIYGNSGRGVIRKTNSTYLSGLYYTSNSGMLLGYKNSTTGEIFSVVPCDPSVQAVVIDGEIVGAMSSSENLTLALEMNYTTVTPTFYYHSMANNTCDNPVLVYSAIGVCADGSLTAVKPKTGLDQPQPIVYANITIPVNFSFSVETEYLQMTMTPVSVDCSVYVCNGNPQCLRLLTQYASACSTIEQALQLSARLEAFEVNQAITISETAVSLANVTYFDSYNLSSVLPKANGRSVIEDILFDKVVTSGLGTVDADYKECSKGLFLADTVCSQYYNGIMVLPGVVDAEKMAMYTASLTGGMVMGGLTAAAAIPFSLAVQARLNYVALQTDVLQKNQQILAESFNNAIGNITNAFSEVNNALQQTSDAISTVAQALNKVQSVVNEQGAALSQLTRQLASNFQAISASLTDIYNRLDGLAADAQADRLINGRLAALNAFVTQTLTKYTDVRASRLLAQQKINECVKSQSKRFGFCGNGTHVFSIPNAAPNGILFFHTVLVPTDFVTVAAWSGVCIDDKGFVLRDFSNVLFQNTDGTYLVTSRDMYEPRVPQASDFVQITGCDVSFVNTSDVNVTDIIPDYIDVNKTLADLLNKLPNASIPNLGVEQYNQTILNLTGEINELDRRAEAIENSTKRLQELINNINSTLVDLEWLNRFENYVKWPWWVWLIIGLAIIFTASLLVFCCISTGCCGCCSCMASSLGGCCSATKLHPYEFEKVHVQ
uniref:S protein n=1 Tax=NL63-related bat coronavirus TaxID=1920748 RepID=A0A1L2KGD0_9ALPC|nr:S protein [NL63-related bat coronavirus]